MEVMPGYKQTEVGILPEEWDVSAIDSVLDEISMGPFGSDIKVSNFVSSGVPVLNGANVAQERLIDSFVNFVTPAKALSLKRAVARRGDIVVTHRGTIGQIAYIPHDSEFERYVISQSQFRVRFSTKVLPSWVVRYFHSESGSKRFLEGKGHTGVPAIAQPTKTFRNLFLPVPPLSEQAAITEAMDDVDALLSGLDALIAKKHAIKRAMMQQLLTGKQRLPGFNGEWEVKCFGELASPRRERIDPKRTGTHDFCVELEHIESVTGKLAGHGATSDESSLKTVFRKGDVLFGKLRAYLRKYWLADRPGVCSTEIWALAANERLVRPEYLLQLVKVDRFIDAASTAYGTHMPRSDWNVVRSFEVALPKEEEQAAIASVLSDMDAEIAALEQKRDKTVALKQGMMQELLTGRIRLI